MQKTRPCVCGHLHEAHEHYRRGSDCAICGAETCAKYRASRAGTPAVDPTPPPASPPARRTDVAGSAR